MKKERWVFTRSELLHGGKGCRGDDELVAHHIACDSELGVIVYRNGQVSDHWEGGRGRVPNDVKERVDGVESLWEPINRNIADTWRDVEVDDKGNLIRVVPTEKRPSPNS